MTNPVLLIDGNNLAHFLYTNLLPGQKMTPTDSQRLIGHLTSYARNYADAVEVELCLDRSPGVLPQTPPGLRVFAAEYPQNGDDLLLGRLAYHLFDERSCLAITNDEAVIEEVLRQGGSVLKVADFVRRAGTAKPVFRDPDDLPRFAAGKQDAQAKQGAGSTTAASVVRISQGTENGKGKKGKRKAQGEIYTAAARPSLAPDPQVVQLREGNQQKPNDAEAASSSAVVEPSEAEQPSSAVPQAEEGPFYLLTLETWPPREGARFLLNAFCQEHAAEYHDLMTTFDRESLRPDDLRALAELLLETCGAEPDFGRKGALMNRVRLALIKAGGGPLSLQALVEQTGLPEKGLRGRIREKAEKWLAILS